jgi:predicted TIM-barrel fold metal-dependent hydrolase
MNVQDVVSYLDRSRIDLCWLMTWEETAPGRWPYQHLSVEAVHEAYLRHPDRFIPMYAPDPLDPEASSKLQRWHAKGIRGCAELKTTASWLAGELEPLLNTVAELGLPLLFHMEEESEMLMPLPSDGWLERLLVRFMRTTRWPNVKGPLLSMAVSRFRTIRRFKHERSFRFPGYMADFSSLSSVMLRYPGINFIGHGPLFWKLISGDATVGGAFFPRGPTVQNGLTCALLREHDNLYADISGRSGFNALSRDSAFSHRFVEDFGHKLLFGTDNLQIGHEDLLLSLGLSSQTRRRVFGENAARLVAGIPT